MKRLMCLFFSLIGTAALLTSCADVADIGKPVTRATTTSATVRTTSTMPTTSTSVTQVDVQATDATQGTVAPIDLPEEQRSPGVTYAVPASSPVDPSYFDDVVFVGDSVSLKLMYYDVANGCLGNAAYLTSGSLGVANALWDIDRADAVHPSYQGQTVTVADGVKKTGRSKVYLMLGINDLALYGVDQTIDNLKTLTTQILRNAPDATLYIQSVTPLYADLGSLSNSLINEYNVVLSNYCRDQGWYFVDVASVLRDTNGCLPRDYCSDPDGMGIHFTDTACRIWVDYLYTHTADA